MKIVFAGTPDFAVPPLKMLVGSDHEIIAVYTQPDRPAGRGRKTQASPVKLVAIENDIPVFQPETLRDPRAIEELAGLKPDLMIVVAYGLLLPRAVIDIPPLGCLNIHASLLPRWRGAAPIQRSILAGDKQTGVTIMHIEEKLDAGDMLGKGCCEIGRMDTAEDVHDRLAQLGAAKLEELLPGIENRSLQPEKQDEALVTYAAKLSKAEAEIDWNSSAWQIQRQVCAFNPWPVAFSNLLGKSLRIWKAEVLEGRVTELPPGTILGNDAKAFDVATGDGILRLVEVQQTGSKRMRAADFLNGNPVQNQRFG